MQIKHYIKSTKWVQRFWFSNQWQLHQNNAFNLANSDLMQNSTIVCQGINNKIISEGGLNIQSWKCQVQGNQNQIYLGKISFIKSGSLKIKGANNEIHIDQDVGLQNVEIEIKANDCQIFIGSFSRLKNSLLLIEDNKGCIRIGDKNTTEGVEFAVTEVGSQIQTGLDCMFSNEITLRTGDSHAIYDRTTHERINKAKNILISDHVWIGAKATLLKGTQINEGSIVATGSIASGTFPSQSIIAGIPAKVIKENIYWTRER
ncbi:MAG: hypothetical protein JJT94_02450 [Bernardetiaceae bacterium]|nr:hypothetical protein [Bernardetiaceae bacterium]